MNITEHVRAAGIVIVAIVVVFIALLTTGHFLSTYSKDGGGGAELQLPLLVIAGLVSLLGILAVMAIAFKTVHLANQTQALGLPDGTVRAVIALSLILIFAVVTVYLFSDLSGPEAESCCKQITARLAESTSTNIQTVTTGSSNATSTGGGSLESINPPAGGSAAGGQSSRSNAAEDFAKQLLIMLGTLITSITSFYFGSKAVSEAPPARTAQLSAPQIRSVYPRPVVQEKFRDRVSLSGTGLFGVNAVALRQGNREVAATDVTSGESEVLFRIPFEKELGRGTWDIVVRTRDGAEASLPGGLEIV